MADDGISLRGSPPDFPPGFGENTRRQTVSPLRRRRTADGEIAAQSEHTPSDTVPLSLMQGIVDRMNNKEQYVESRLDRSELALANLSSLVAGVQGALQALLTQLSTPSAPASAQPTVGTSAIPTAPNAPSVAVPQTTPVSAAGTASAGQPATPAAVPVIPSTQPAGVGAVGVSSSTQPHVPVSATGTGAASSQHATASSGGTPGVVSGFSVKDLKIPDLPLLGRSPNALPYTKWCKAVRIKLGAVGVGAVLSDDWTPSTPEEVQWWNCVNPLVYAALYDSVQKYDTLSDNIARFYASEGAGRLAWNAIKAFHVRLAEGNKETLLLKLNALVPSERESMESFLCRCNNLREEFQQYNLTLDDSLLISHVFGQLDHTWRWMSDMANIPADALSWDDVSEALQRQDNQRRQGQKQNPLILPLGWVARDLYQKSKVGAAHAVQRGSTRHPSHSAGGKGNGIGNKGVPRNGTREAHTSGIPGQRSGNASLVCFCCLEFGHGCLECPKRTPGWKVTPEVRAKALSLRDSYLKKGGRPPKEGGRLTGNASAVHGSQFSHHL